VRRKTTTAGARSFAAKASPTRPPLCGQSLSGAKPTSLLYGLLDYELKRHTVFDLDRLQRSVADPR